MSQAIRSRLVVLELQTPQFYFAPGDTNVFTGPRKADAPLESVGPQAAIGLTHEKLQLSGMKDVGTLTGWCSFDLMLRICHADSFKVD